MSDVIYGELVLGRACGLIDCKLNQYTVLVIMKTVIQF